MCGLMFKLVICKFRKSMALLRPGVIKQHKPNKTLQLSSFFLPYIDIHRRCHCLMHGFPLWNRSYERSLSFALLNDTWCRYRHAASCMTINYTTFENKTSGFKQNRLSVSVGGDGHFNCPQWFISSLCSYLWVNTLYHHKGIIYEPSLINKIHEQFKPISAIRGNLVNCVFFYGCLKKIPDHKHDK